MYGARVYRSLWHVRLPGEGVHAAAQDLQHVFGSPDLCILFTSTVSHNMVRIASQEARKRSVPLKRSHTSSLAALNAMLEDFTHSDKAQKPC